MKGSPNELVTIPTSGATNRNSNNSIRDSAENSKEIFENRDYSFDISENLPSKLLANDLIADTGSSNDVAALAAEQARLASVNVPS